MKPSAHLHLTLMFFDVDVPWPWPAISSHLMFTFWLGLFCDGLLVCVARLHPQVRMEIECMKTLWCFFPSLGTWLPSYGTYTYLPRAVHVVLYGGSMTQVFPSRYLERAGDSSRRVVKADTKFAGLRGVRY